jgi:SAM-dependent methyltransferase
MNWKMKALLHNVMPLVPGGDRCHFWIQRHITRKIPRTEQRFLHAISIAEKHIDSFRRLSETPVQEATFYEFGAGWDLATQLTFFALGVNHQIIVDVKPLLRKELANDSAQRIRTLRGHSFRRVPDKTLGKDLVHDLRAYYGIDYFAPCDAKHTMLPDSSVDCITCTETVAHIPEPDLNSIFAECARILKPGGIISMSANYDDLYSYFDHSISAYNFLKYSDGWWRIFNPFHHFQNRLRHSDYLRLFTRVGLEIVEEEKKLPTPQDLDCLSGLTLSKEFRNYTAEDLAIHGAHFVVRHKPTLAAVAESKSELNPSIAQGGKRGRSLTVQRVPG